MYLYKKLIEDIKKGAKRVSFDLGKTWVSDPKLPENIAEKIKGRLIYYYDKKLTPLALFDDRYYALTWTNNAPILEIDGIRMHVFYLGSPFAYARYVAKIMRGGSRYLETCFGQGYISRLINNELVSYEKNRAVLEIAKMNPWSQDALKKHTIKNEDVWNLKEGEFDRIIHDPPSYRTAPDLYSRSFYELLADHAKPNALLYHYVGQPKSRRRFSIESHVIENAKKAGWRLVKKYNKIKGLLFSLNHRI